MTSAGLARTDQGVPAGYAERPEGHRLRFLYVLKGSGEGAGTAR
jgi:hypothetical protein